VGRPVSGAVRKFKSPLKKTQPFSPCSRALNWTSKGLNKWAPIGKLSCEGHNKLSHILFFSFANS